MAANQSSNSGPPVQQSPTTEQVSLAVKWPKEFWHASRGRYPELWYKFKRFESPALLNLYLYQDELVQLQQDSDRKDGSMLIEQRTSLRALIKDYCKPQPIYPGDQPVLNRLHIRRSYAIL